MAKIRANIGIYSVIKDTGAEEGATMNLIVPGTIERDSAGLRICYEKAADEESNRMQQVSVLIEDGLVTVVQAGDMVSQLAFSRGNRSSGYYRTPFGNMEMGIFTTLLEAEEIPDEAGGASSIRLTMEYQMDMNGMNAGHHALLMTADPVRA